IYVSLAKTLSIATIRCMASPAALPLVLLYDGRSDLQSALAPAVAAAGCKVRDFSRPSLLADSARDLNPSMVVMRFSAPQEREIFAVVERLRQIDRSIPVVFVATDGSERLAIDAL